MNLENLNVRAGHGSGEFSAVFQSPSHYSVLNVDPSATRLMIREAYLRLKNLYSGGGDGLYGMASGSDLDRHLAEIETAFAVLNDDTARAAYDRQLAAPQAAASAPEWTQEADMWVPLPGGAGSEHIQTSRSTLKVTRTQACGSHDESFQSRLIAAMNDGDVADGSILVTLREISGVSQAEIQERTKISLEYIRGMENNQFDRLPQVVYVKGFMRSYLRYLNVPNLDKIVTAYAARLEAWQAGQK